MDVTVATRPKAVVLPRTDATTADLEAHLASERLLIGALADQIVLVPRVQRAAQRGRPQLARRQAGAASLRARPASGPQPTT